ncbi:hypothetical protein AcV7_010170 [Taiwanofungus camphoratus]|nr:hypothetical protein AcV7_010170 [Antrodia cinnamomea]
MEGQQSLSGNIRVGVPRLHACPMAPVGSKDRELPGLVVSATTTAAFGSTTYDGDIECNTTQGPDGAQPSGSYSSAPSVASTLTSPVTSPATNEPEPTAPSATLAVAQGSLAAEGTANIAVEAFNPARPHRRIFRSSCAGSSQVKA